MSGSWLRATTSVFFCAWAGPAQRASVNTPTARQHPALERIMISSLGRPRDDRAVHHVLEQRAIGQALFGRLHHEDDEEILLRIDPEVGAAGAAPVELSDRARHRRH